MPMTPVTVKVTPALEGHATRVWGEQHMQALEVQLMQALEGPATQALVAQLTAALAALNTTV